jgi:ammonia channel protein AmtB
MIGLMKGMKVKILLPTIVFVSVTVFSMPAFAESAGTDESVIGAIDVEELKQGLDTVWVLIAAFLVFFMQAGFGMVEAGFIRAKNTCNILTKNFLDFCMASLGFFLIGYGLMFGSGNGFWGLKGWCLFGLEPTVNGLPLYAFWLFQAAFCGAAATIVAGGMAERMKFHAYLIYSFIISALIYPIVGHIDGCTHSWRIRGSCGNYYS